MTWAVPRHNISYTPREYFLLIRAFFAGSNFGKNGKTFETEFSGYIGAGDCFAFWSGSAALFHGVQAAGLVQDDKILFPEYEFTTVAKTLRLCGLKLCFTKVDAHSGNITLETLRRAYGQNPDSKAVLVANIHGRCADLAGISEFCKKKGLLLIEDCAHSAGASIDGVKAGSFGDFSIFSFGHGKSLVACGGGALVTDNPQIVSALNNAKGSLKPPPWQFVAKGLLSGLAKGLLSTKVLFTIVLFPVLYLLSYLGGKNILDDALAQETDAKNDAPPEYFYQFPESYALLGLSQLGRLDGLNEKRIQNAKLLLELLLQEKRISTPPSFTGSEHVCLNFLTDVPDGAGFARRMLRKGVDIRHDYLLYYGEKNPNGVRPENSIYLPNHPGLGKRQIKKVATAALKVAGGK